MSYTYLRFEIAVNYFVVAHKSQWLKHLGRKAPYKSCRKSNEAVRFDELVEVYAEQFHGDTQVTTEVEVLSHFDNMMFFIRILLINTR